MTISEIEYIRRTNETGGIFYCPVNADQNRADLQNDLDDCVEASIIGRYAGNIKRVEQM
jgi:hypothetical protein